MNGEKTTVGFDYLLFDGLLFCHSERIFLATSQLPEYHHQFFTGSFSVDVASKPDTHFLSVTK
jgi:hypothetical protein